MTPDRSPEARCVSTRQKAKFDSRTPSRRWYDVSRVPFSKVPANCQPSHRHRAHLNTADLNIKVGIHVSPPYINREGFKSFERFSDTNKRLMFDRTRIIRSDLVRPRRELHRAAIYETYVMKARLLWRLFRERGVNVLTAAGSSQPHSIDAYVNDDFKCIKIII